MNDRQCINLKMIIVEERVNCSPEELWVGAELIVGFAFLVGRKHTLPVIKISPL
ncbi:MAG TPA: hypothetical protein VFZ58_00585 [Candidatus Saccharimonadales bacterium]